MRTLVKRWVAVAIAMMLMITGCVAIGFTSATHVSAAYAGSYAQSQAADCVQYAKARFLEIYGFELHPAGGNYADSYYYTAANWGDTVSDVPAKGALAVWTNGPHVAIVEDVIGDTVYYSEGGFDGHYNEGHRNRYSMASAYNTTFLGYVYVAGTNVGGGTPVNPPTPSVTTSWTQSMETTDNVNGTFRATISTDTNVTFSEAGMMVWQDGVQVGQASEGTNVSGFYMDMWYTNQELGMTMSPGHTYTYQFYAVANGQRYESEVYSYTTPGAPALVTSWNDYSSFDHLTANFYGTISTNNQATFTEQGITVWEDGNTFSQLSGPASSSDWYLNIPYSMTLSAGHTYTYQFYAVANGQRYESEMYSYTTPAPEPTQKQNQWTQELSMEGWTYGESANAPAASAQYGEVVFTYSDAEDGIYSAEIPTNAGTYYVKAEVAETSEYTGLTATTSFTIAKATPELPDVGELNAIYGQQLSDIALPDGMAWSENQGKEFDGTVGDCQTGKLFYVDYTPVDTKNYVALLEQPVSVDVLPRDISDLELPEITADTNLEELSLTLDGLELVLDRDYTIETWEDAENGVMVVNFEGTGNYTGICSATYPLAEEPVTPPEEGNDPGTTTPDDNSGNDNGSANGTEAGSDVPQTGDNTAFAITWLAAAMLLSGCGVIIAVKKQKKSR